MLTAGVGNLKKVAIQSDEKKTTFKIRMEVETKGGFSNFKERIDELATYVSYKQKEKEYLEEYVLKPGRRIYFEGKMVGLEKNGKIIKMIQINSVTNLGVDYKNKDKGKNNNSNSQNSSTDINNKSGKSLMESYDDNSKTSKRDQKSLDNETNLDKDYPF